MCNVQVEISGCGTMSASSNILLLQQWVEGYWQSLKLHGEDANKINRIQNKEQKMKHKEIKAKAKKDTEHNK